MVNVSRRLWIGALLLWSLPSWGQGGDSGGLIRVATYNVHWANDRLEEVVDAIRRADADVVFLQETTPRSEHFLRQRLRRSHPHAHFAGHEGRLREERLGFLSRFPIKEPTFAPPQQGLFGSLRAACEIDGISITLVNVHLSPFLVTREAGIGEWMRRMQETEATHAAEIAAVSDHFDPARPAIIAGDFNSLSTFAAPTHLTELGLIDSFAAVHEDADTHPTWRWPTRPLPLRLRIDYLFHTHHFQTAESRILTRPGSDHSMVVSELRLIGDGRAPVREEERRGAK